MATTIVGLYDQASQAQSVVSELESSGYSRKYIELVQAGAQTSGLSSTLTSHGVPSDDAALYAQGVQHGGTLVSLRADEQDADRAIAIFNRYNPIDIEERSMQWSGGTQTASTADVTTTHATAAAATSRPAAAASTQNVEGQTAIPIVEEELRVGKRTVESGGVQVRTYVQERPVNEQVTLRQENVEVHREAVNRPVTDADSTAFQEGTIEVRERSEEAVVQKQAHVVEEVHIKKDVEEHTEQIQDTVRRTDVDVQQVPGANTQTSGYQTTGTTNVSGSGTDEGAIERNASKLGNAAERGLGADLDSDGDVGRRDPRNNI